ncbi:DinB family protein [Rhodococcus sp. D2-41]|uniref:DinB family protein n=1 Tax=Speluncibacter jeojiensis TaxID=2710754 RepID=A0A9X4RD52_9ACTN|nr:DinB family protein [Rhodococcus sp. D2-41]MDG3010520.1 DinB family protein [Rhodococcus sp. D2-41]MDG3014269.1 DinB family protein [Corynebacteriales bacterium D3-21]
MTPTPETQALLRDSFERIREQVVEMTSDLPDDIATYRPDPEANSIDWLLWHLIRVQDDHLAGITGTEQVWTAGGWCELFALPFDPEAIGYGQSSDEVGRVRVAANLLDAYHADVHAATLRYLDTLTTDELDRIVDRRWDPPVSAAVRLVSVIGDCTAHLGQAQYVRGMALRRG